LLRAKAAAWPGPRLGGIKRAPGGAVVLRDTGGTGPPAPYWDAVAADRPMSTAWDEPSAVESVRRLLTESVAKRMMSDVPIGVFLSGGLDSSAIVALMAPMVSQPINTFSAGIADVPGYDEFEFARDVAKRFSTNHEEV